MTNRTTPAAAPPAATAVPSPKPVFVPAGPLRPVLMPATRLCEAMAMIMLVAATTLIMIEVIARGVFNVGIPWADELARFSGLGVIFLTVPLLLARDSHVRVDLFLNLLGGQPKRLVGILNELLTLLFCSLFLIACYWFMQRAGRFSTPALAIPNLLYYAPAMVGMLLTALVALDRVIGALLGRTTEAPSAWESV